MSHYDDWAEDYLSKEGSNIAYANGIWSFGSAMRHTPETLRALGISEDDIERFRDVLGSHCDTWPIKMDQKENKLIKEDTMAVDYLSKMSQIADATKQEPTYVDFGQIEINEQDYKARRTINVEFTVEWPLQFPANVTSQRLKDLLSEYIQDVVKDMRKDLAEVLCPMSSVDEALMQAARDGMVKKCCKKKTERPDDGAKKSYGSEQSYDYGSWNADRKG